MDTLKNDNPNVTGIYEIWWKAAEPSVRYELPEASTEEAVFKGNKFSY